ncbi:uncharacterized protein ColSpa_01437 [Colletotrichum spaethianum]|uniref:Cell wall protein n=1 Tax=Colletotrichum spaethianum TaxID=700344 RepID=A0AA37P4H9_9PEZI|nr:uncharacterized protein ColSpa_01437 [Colletotrichum spaethianum]GKT41256.1 hypothetical protein ColSpa_01437 [Colletotrichum spaethianum]
MHAQTLVLGLLGQAVLLLAAPLKPRAVIERRNDLDNIQATLAPIFASLQNVDVAVLGLGTPASAANLLAASQQVQVSLNQATVNVRAIGDLSAAKSLKLRQTTDSLASQTRSTLNDLVARKPILDQLGVSNVALQSLQQQRVATMSLSQALAEKVPRVGQKDATADQISLQAIFNQAIAAFSIPATPGAAVPAPAVPATTPPIMAIAVPPPQRKSSTRRKDKKKAKNNMVDGVALA